MKTLHQALNDYLALRRGLGFKLRQDERRLTSFLSFLEDRGANYITSQLALEWSMQSSEWRPCAAQRLVDVRGFARYLVHFDPRTEVPPKGQLHPGGRAKPYLYTEDQIRRLMDAAEALPPLDGLRRWTYSCLFGLLAVTGLRISEALNLRREDVDLTDGVLTIRGTKFGKTRLVPLHPSTRQSLKSYGRRRDAHLGDPRSPYFLVAERGGQLHAKHIYPVFHRLLRNIGLRGPNIPHRPRLHDIRHRYASETLLRWYKSGEDIEARLPILSTFLGHTNVRDTYWYLSARPELMHLAALRLQNRWGIRS